MIILFLPPRPPLPLYDVRNSMPTCICVGGIVDRTKRHDLAVQFNPSTMRTIATLSEAVAALLLLHLCGCGSANDCELGKLVLVYLDHLHKIMSEPDLPEGLLGG